MDYPLLTSDEQDALVRWASGLLVREIPMNNPATIHIDEVFRGLGSDCWLVKTFGSFRVLLEIAGAMPGVQVVACIGLIASRFFRKKDFFADVAPYALCGD